MCYCICESSRDRVKKHPTGIKQENQDRYQEGWKRNAPHWKSTENVTSVKNANSVRARPSGVRREVLCMIISYVFRKSK